MLFTELTDQELKDYTKLRCDEMKVLYDDLKRSIMKMTSTEDKIEKFDLMVHIAELINKLSFEHLDTLDRYLLAYESNKRLENVITKLKGEEEED